MEECTVILIGYEGFSKYWPNPAGELVTRFDGLVINGCRLRGVTIPVSISAVKSRLGVFLADADLAIGVGLAPNARIPRLELAAVNLLHFKVPDESGVKVEAAEIIEDGPLTLPTGLPFKAIYHRCREEGLPFTLGLGTGTYLCNTMAYLLHAWSRETGKPAGFIHIPPDTNTAMRSMLSHGLPLWIMEKVLHCVIDESMRKLEEHRVIK